MSGSKNDNECKLAVFTRADHIRAMSDEEIAKTLVNIMDSVLYYPRMPFVTLAENQRKAAAELMLKILRQPSKGGGDELAVYNHRMMEILRGRREPFDWKE